MKLTRRELIVTGLVGLGACTGLEEAVEVSPPTPIPPTAVPPTASGPTTTRAVSTTTSPTIPSASRMLRASVPVVARLTWGDPPGQGFVTHELERITIHHTAVVTDKETSGAERARRHLRHHRSLGWPDLAYHHLIDAQGVIYEGRPLEAVGDTGTSYDPTGHYLPCLEGDFDRQTPTPLQLDSLVRLVAAIADRFSLDPATIFGHGDYAPATTCPGSAVMAVLDDLRTQVVSQTGRHRIHVVG